MMSILNMSMSIMNKINNFCHDFLWNHNVSCKKRIPLLAWDKVCNAKENDGVGIRQLNIQNVALEVKMFT